MSDGQATESGGARGEGTRAVVLVAEGQRAWTWKNSFNAGFDAFHKKAPGEHGVGKTVSGRRAEPSSPSPRLPPFPLPSRGDCGRRGGGVIHTVVCYFFVFISTTEHYFQSSFMTGGSISHTSF